jgi:GNAT superfamily N-acetyltransferase
VQKGIAMSGHQQAMSRDRWPVLESDNMIEMLSYLGTSPFAERQVTQEIEWVITGVDDNTFNGVVRAQLSEARVDEIIDDLAARFQARNIPHLWFVRSDSRPADLGQRLVAHGWRRLRPGVGMAIDLSASASPFPPVPDLRIERTANAADIALWGGFHRYLEGGQRDKPRERLYVSVGLGGEQPLRHYIAWLGSEPVGALSLFLGHEAAGIYNVYVADQWRRRGIGTATTRLLLEEAHRLGASVGVVAPTRESRSMYARLGFILHQQMLPMYWYPPQS